MKLITHHCLSPAAGTAISGNRSIFLKASAVLFILSVYPVRHIFRLLAFVKFDNPVLCIELNKIRFADPKVFFLPHVKKTFPSKESCLVNNFHFRNFRSRTYIIPIKVHSTSSEIQRFIIKKFNRIVFFNGVYRYHYLIVIDD